MPKIPALRSAAADGRRVHAAGLRADVAVGAEQHAKVRAGVARPSVAFVRRAAQAQPPVVWQVVEAQRFAEVGPAWR
jgi:hypothetical protein